jgi:hypothetical protein
MAMDIFAIPSMSAKCERVFSSVKLLITDRRRRLGNDIIDISECLRHWYGSAKHSDFDAQPSNAGGYDSSDKGDESDGDGDEY